MENSRSSVAFKQSDTVDTGLDNLAFSEEMISWEEKDLRFQDCR